MTLELEAIKKLVPKSQRTLITQEFVDKIEGSLANSEIAEEFKENFVTYLGVLSAGKFKMQDYISAVMYVTHKLLGRNNIDAWAATFPDRYSRIKSEGQEQIAAYASMYNSNKLVNLIYQQTLIPSYVLNAPLHQQALNNLAAMLIDPSVRGLVRVKACEAILAHTKPPEVIKGEITIGIDQQETIGELRAVVEDLVTIQRDALTRGHKTLREIAEAKIIDTSYTEINEDEDSYSPLKMLPGEFKI